MNGLKAVIAFFADDLASAVMVLIWIGLAAVAARLAPHMGPSGGIVFFLGILGVLAHGVWRRARSI